MEPQQPDGSIPRQCTARSKRSGERCRKPAMRGRTVCRAHGGATPRGVASPHFKHGRWSKDLPAKLITRYEEARSDIERLSLEEEVALVDTRIGVLLGELRSVPVKANSDPIWLEVRQLIELRRRLVEAQVRHEVMAQRTVSIDQVMALAAGFAAAVRRHTHDAEALTAIYDDIEELLGGHSMPFDRDLHQVGG